MADFLLELFSEEIPARMQEKAAADLARLFGEALSAAGLSAQLVTGYATPRRLSLIVRGLPKQTEAVREERRGPRADAPEQALAGFLKSTGLTRDQLEERDDPKGRFLYAVIEKPGRATSDVLSEMIPALIKGFPWPKSMRWGTASSSTSSMRWVRPLKSIIALFDGVPVNVVVEGVPSGNVTQGHRFHHPAPINISSVDEYAVKLHEAKVVLDTGERRRLIDEGARLQAESAGLELIEDAGLLAENAGLTEWPVPLLGRFDPAFLAVPPEVIQLTMRVNQKYFVLNNKVDGTLAPAFICVANIEAADGGRSIVAGNEKVLAARLSDARFFWEQDLKTPLAEFAKRLSDIVFHEKLGTVADKVGRIAQMARWLVEQSIVGDGSAALADCAEQAARLSKADLVTAAVGEFPELQGVMGGYYAKAEGLDVRVADAIRDHYKPLGQGDTVPDAPVTIAVSLADKLDTLCQFFVEDMKPTGSKDPFALRRAGLGILELIIRNNLRCDIGSVIAYSIGTRTDARAEDIESIKQFLLDRLKVQQREAGVRHDLIDAVVALGDEGDVVRLLARVKALQALITTEGGANLLAGYKRAANILRIEEQKGGLDAVSEHSAEPAEKALADALDSVEPEARRAVEQGDFEAAMAALARLRAPIDAFFDQVTVNDPQAGVRAARLGLLRRIRDAVHAVANFSRIEG